jgi:lipoprotein NlpD
MLNGQLSLTGLEFAGAQGARRSRVFFLTGIIACAVLAGCASKETRAPVVDMTNNPNAAATAPSAGGTYVVKPGDTLYKISRANGVDVESLKRWNNLTDSNHLAVGQVLKLAAPAGGSATSTTPAKAQPRPLDQKEETSPQPQPLPPPGEEPPPPANPEPSAAGPTTPPPVTPAPTPVETPKTTRASDASVINWGWPANGQLVQTFSATTKGIDIAGNPGDPVVAAAAGKVMYSGNGVRGLGNLIIINHQNGFITAYAHNRALLVKTGADVKKGDKVAEIGQTDTTSPRLHFEIRRQGTPVDPLQYLPAKP